MAPRAVLAAALASAMAARSAAQILLGSGCRSLDEGIPEERRLAYVAFTRAMQRLLVTWTTTGFRGSGSAQPSRFLFDVPDDVVDGDLPSGEPAAATPRVATLPAAAKEKLASLVASLPRKALPPNGEYTLLDIEDDSQLDIGVRVLHERWGAGTISRIRTGTGVEVSFDGVGRRLVRPHAETLRLLVE